MSYAESIPISHPVDVIARVSDNPLRFIGEDPGGAHAIDLSIDLPATEDRITLSIPSTE